MARPQRNFISSKKIGTSFEDTAEKLLLMSGFSVIRIPDGCRTFGYGIKTRMIRIKSPFDFLAAKDGKAIFFDCKTYQNNSIAYSQINENQIEKLLSLERQGHLAGYLIYFREHDDIRFFKASQLNEVKKRQGLLPEQGQHMGSLLTFKPWGTT